MCAVKLNRCMTFAGDGLPGDGAARGRHAPAGHPGQTELQLPHTGSRGSQQ